MTGEGLCRTTALMHDHVDVGVARVEREQLVQTAHPFGGRSRDPFRGQRGDKVEAPAVLDQRVASRLHRATSYVTAPVSAFATSDQSTSEDSGFSIR